MKNNTVVIGIVALLVGAGLGYFGAHLSSSQQAAGQRTAGSYGTGGYTGMRGTASGASGSSGFISGVVASEDSESITVDTKDGSSHVVLVTPDTTVSKTVDGTIADVAVGSTVIVSGSTNSDGSVSAQMVQVRPAGSMTTSTTTEGIPPTPTVSPAQ